MFAKLRKTTISVCNVCLSICLVYLFVCPSTWNTSAPIGWIFMKFDIWVYFFRKPVLKIQISLKCDKKNDSFTWRLCEFIMIWYLDMIYLLTAIGLSPGGSSTVHIYTQTIHRTIHNKQYIEQHNNWMSAGRAPSWLVIPWHLPYNRGKSRKNLSQGSRV